MAARPLRYPAPDSDFSRQPDLGPRPEAFVYRKLSARGGIALSLHRSLHFRPALECSARDPLLCLLPRVIRPLLVSLHRQAQFLRLGGLLGATCRLAHRARALGAFRPRLPGKKPRKPDRSAGPVSRLLRA